MTLYGYARVSVREPEDKNLDLQVERLVRAGCALGNVRAEEASGAKNDRGGLLELLDLVVAGDTLVVTHIDRLSRPSWDQRLPGVLQPAETSPVFGLSNPSTGVPKGPGRKEGSSSRTSCLNHWVHLSLVKASSAWLGSWGVPRRRPGAIRETGTVANVGLLGVNSWPEAESKCRGRTQ